MFGRRRELDAGVRTGRPQVRPQGPSHVRGVTQANIFHGDEGAVGLLEVGGETVASSRRSTGITPEASDVIDPSMPRLSPA